MKRSSSRWTEEEDRTIRSMYELNTSAAIAALLGRTEPSVRNRCWTLGLSTKANPWTEEEVARLRAAYSAETSDAIGLDELARELGRHKTNVSRKARELGLTNRARQRKSVRKGPRLPKFSTVEELKAWMSVSSKERIAKNGHPRGMLGRTHTVATKEAIAEKSRALWAAPDSPFRTERMTDIRTETMLRNIRAGKMGGQNAYSRSKKGAREDLGGLFLRSRWEANYARFLNTLVASGQIDSWVYEPFTFWFLGIKRGTRFYTPDFIVLYPDGHHEWHEVKGWMNQRSRTQLDRMARYYPDEKVAVIGRDWFAAAWRTGLAQCIPHWEVVDGHRF